MDTLTKQQYDKLLKPCVYLFWMNSQCLYIGMSQRGILRPLDPNHHVKDFMSVFDKLELRWCINVSEAQKLEQKLIRDLKPLYNKIDKRRTTSVGLKRQSRADRIAYIKKVIGALYEAGLVGGRK